MHRFAVRPPSPRGSIINISLPRTAAATAVVILALTLTACAGGTGGTDEGTKGAAADVPLGPLDEYFQKMYGGAEGASNEQLMADSNAQQAKAEEITAACMADEGFEYVPMDQSSMSSFTGDELDVDWGTKEFAEQYGYGATTDPGGFQAAAATADPDEAGMVDPNQDAVSAMSESEQQAYFVALYGNQAEVDPAADPDAVVEYDWEQSGCQGRGQHEVYEGGMEADEFAGLQADITAMYESAATDPRLADLNAKWASCMADAGFTGLAAVGDGETSIYDEVGDIQEAAYADLDPAVAVDEASSAQLEADVAAKLAEITPREIKTAVADFGCREDVDYDAVSGDVNLELQRDFVDAHKAELDTWLAAVTESKS